MVITLEKPSYNMGDDTSNHGFLAMFFPPYGRDPAALLLLTAVFPQLSDERQADQRRLSGGWSRRCRFRCGAGGKLETVKISMGI